MKKVILTGAAGFIGFHLTKKLIDLGYYVLGVDNMNNYYDINLKKDRLKKLGIINPTSKSEEFISSKTQNFVFINLDINSINNLEKLTELKSFNFFIHLAAQAGVRFSLKNPNQYFQSNILGFYTILEFLNKNNLKNLIYASSSSVYGDQNIYPFEESLNTDSQLNLYSASKKINEILAKAYYNLNNINSIGLRFFTVYGPFGRPDMAYYSFTNKILNNQEIELYNNGTSERDYTYIDDIIEYIIRLLEIKATEKSLILNIGNSKPVILNDFVDLLQQKLKKKAIIKLTEGKKEDMIKTYSNSNKIQKLTGYIPKTDISSGLDNFLTWYKKYNKA